MKDIEIKLFITALREPSIQKKIYELILHRFPALESIQNEPATDNSIDHEELKAPIEKLKRESEELHNRLRLSQLNNTSLQQENEEMVKIISFLKNLFKCPDTNSLCTTIETQTHDLTGSVEKHRSVGKDLQTKLDTTENELKLLKSQFSEDLKIAELFNNLSESTKLSLSGIFKDTTPKGLIACGIQENNISNLWDFIKKVALEPAPSDLELLKELFLTLFNRFRLAFPMLSLASSEIDRDFDTQKHIRHNNSSAMSGKIKEVILLGYYNNKTGAVIKQSVVKL